MIDLISYGLALRQKLKTSATPNPQVIRSDSASLHTSSMEFSAISAESAAIARKTEYINPLGKDQIVNNADIADIAEVQGKQPRLVADESRESCGLTTSPQEEIGNNQENQLIEPIKTVCACGYRPPICSCGFWKFPG